MTDLEKAEQLVNSFLGDEYWIDTEAAIVLVAAAIREAAEQERERCAKVAENLFAGDIERALRVDGYNAALAVAAHIRALD